MCLRRGMWTWIWERPGWVEVRIRVEAKQMAAGVRGKDDYQETAGPEDHSPA